MTLDEAMSTLKKLGTEQNRRIYRRHGAGDDLFGVSFGELKKLVRRIKRDQSLAEQLWETGNTDAQTLALMIADPALLKSSQVDAWLRAISYSLLADYLATLVAQTDFALNKMSKWTKQKKELTRVCGYAIVCTLLKDVPDALSDEDCRSLLQRIEAEIHSSANRARHTMIMTVCAIGIARPQLRDEAVATARRIGPVQVDHGETNCTTPDAEAYILKAAQRKGEMRRRC
ncbi:MAG: DNA alkylation repair protein [Planctomycetota bacterium]|jgi:3-methyladenine DNA glycosylase AlkD